MDSGNRIEDKLDHIADRLSSIDVTLGKQSVILDEHIKRTQLLEDRVEPIEKRMHMVQGIIALITLLAIIGAGLEVILRK